MILKRINHFYYGFLSREGNSGKKYEKSTMTLTKHCKYQLHAMPPSLFYQRGNKI